jgi:hypothetical protein
MKKYITRMHIVITLLPAIRPPRSRAAVLWPGGEVAVVVVGPAVTVLAAVVVAKQYS